MDFFQRRLEALEKELVLERERANSTQAQLQAQVVLKSEVENHLKAMSEQLRREKAEKDGAEEKSRAQGRVEALELRLDEMNSTFAQLLKEAVSRQPSATLVPMESLGAELSVFRRTIKDVAEQVARWRDDMKELPSVLPELRALSARTSDEERLIEGALTRRFDEFNAKLQTAVSDWERRHDIERRAQDDRLRTLSEERTALARLWEEQGQALRQEFLKERISREVEVSNQLAELNKRLENSSYERSPAAASMEAIREQLERLARTLSAAPKAKDEIIVELEQEKADLMRSMRDRHEQLRSTLEERRQIEMTMGESLLKLAADLERERGKTRAAAEQTDEFKSLSHTLSARIADFERTQAERDARVVSLGAERDELVRALVTESEKYRSALAERTASDERWHQRTLELQRKVEEETARAGAAAETTADLRAKIALMSDQMTRSFQERDAVVARFADWERERQRLLDALKQKDGMVSMLSSAFKGSLKKP